MPPRNLYDHPYHNYIERGQHQITDEEDSSPFSALYWETLTAQRQAEREHARWLESLAQPTPLPVERQFGSGGNWGGARFGS